MATGCVSSEQLLVNNFREAEIKPPDMGYLAPENRQLQDSVEQHCMDTTVEDGNSQGGQTNTKLRESHLRGHPDL